MAHTDTWPATEHSPWRERALILALARGASADAETEQLVVRCNWRILIDELTRRRLLGLLGQRLIAGVPASAVADCFVTAVNDAVTAGRRDSLRKQMVTWGLVQELEQTGIKAMPLKGPFLAERLHGDPGLRLSRDIDILVSPADLRSAIATLEELGYVRPRVSDALPQLHHIFESDNGPQVELHWRIHWYESEYAQELLQRSDLDNGVRQPQAADDLVALLLFHARDGLAGLRAPVDVAAWWRKHGAGVDRGELGAIVAHHPALSRPVAAAALAVEALLGVPVSSLLDQRARTRRGTVAALRLADWRPAGSSAEIDVVTKVVDGLLTNPVDLLSFVRRAAFPQLPGGPVARRVSRALYAIHFAARSAPVFVKVLTGGPDRSTPTSAHPER